MFNSFPSPVPNVATKLQKLIKPSPSRGGLALDTAGHKQSEE